MVFFKNPSNDLLDYALLTDLYPNGLSIAWQLIQIFVMSVAEILFSISGIAFAFSQAPASMKSACQALWFIAVAFGNLIVVIVAESRSIENQVYEYILFAAIMAVGTVVFFFITIFYKYRDDNVPAVEAAKQKGEETKHGHVNNASPNNDDDNILVL